MSESAKVTSVYSVLCSLTSLCGFILANVIGGALVYNSIPFILGISSILFGIENRKRRYKYWLVPVVFGVLTLLIIGFIMGLGLFGIERLWIWDLHSPLGYIYR